MAVAKIISYDYYRTYKNSAATGTQILKVTRLTVLSFGLLMGLLAIILTFAGVTLEFTYYFMGIAIGGAVPPIYFCVNWNKASSNGAISGAITGPSPSPRTFVFPHTAAGTICGLISWIATAAALNNGRVTLESLGNNGRSTTKPFLVGNLVSLCASAMVCAVMSWKTPQNYDWDTMQVVHRNATTYDKLHEPAGTQPKSFPLTLLRPSNSTSRITPISLSPQETGALLRLSSFTSIRPVIVSSARSRTGPSSS